MNIYIRLNALEERLCRAGFVASAERIKNATYSSSVATEILCLISEALKQTLDDDSLPKDIENEIKIILSDIKETLAKSNFKLRI